MLACAACELRAGGGHLPEDRRFPAFHPENGQRSEYRSCFSVDPCRHPHDTCHAATQRTPSLRRRQRELSNALSLSISRSQRVSERQLLSVGRQASEVVSQTRSCGLHCKRRSQPLALSFFTPVHLALLARTCTERIRYRAFSFRQR